MSEENNKIQNENNNTKNDDDCLEQTLLGHKTKPETDLDSLQISSTNKNFTNNNNLKNEITREFASISAFTNNENKPLEVYDYGYSILLINEGEKGLIEDFLNEKPNESTTSDFFNFHLDEEKWIKILNHSILVHYERHIRELKDEIDKRKRMANLIPNGTATVAPQIMTAMNPMMLHYQQMYLQNWKNMQMAMQNK